MDKIVLITGASSGIGEASNWGKSPGKDEPPSNLYH